MSNAAAQDSSMIEELKAETLWVPIKGTAPLIMNAWSEKAKRMMLQNAQGKKSIREPKDPEQEYKDAAYRCDDDRYGYPVLAFKAATVEASRFYGKSVSKVGLKQSLFFTGEYSKSAKQQLVPITGEPTMREDVVRVGMNGSDLRYRPEFADWQTEITVTYVQTVITRDSVLSLINAGGLGTGIGEWRPQRSGNFGTYEIDSTRDLQVMT